MRLDRRQLRAKRRLGSVRPEGTGHAAALCRVSRSTTILPEDVGQVDWPMRARDDQGARVVGRRRPPARAATSLIVGVIRNSLSDGAP